MSEQQLMVAPQPHQPAPPARGFLILAEANLYQLLKAIEYLPKEIQTELFGVLGASLTLSNLNERELRLFDIRIDYICELVLGWLEYSNKLLPEHVTLIEQIKMHAKLQLRRSKGGFWSKLIAGSDLSAQPTSKKGILSKLFG